MGIILRKTTKLGSWVAGLALFLSSFFSYGQVSCSLENQFSKTPATPSPQVRKALEAYQGDACIRAQVLIRPDFENLIRIEEAKWAWVSLFTDARTRRDHTLINQRFNKMNDLIEVHRTAGITYRLQQQALRVQDCLEFNAERRGEALYDSVVSLAGGEARCDGGGGSWMAADEAKGFGQFIDPGKRAGAYVYVDEPPVTEEDSGPLIGELRAIEE